LINLLEIWPFRLVEAEAVRRHGHRMVMVVMTMVAVALHLRNNPKQDASVCQIRRCEFLFTEKLAKRRASGAEWRDALSIG
jgi:hypothetical protein